MPSSHLILCHPLLLLPPIPPSIKDFSNESTFFLAWGGQSTGVSALASFLPKKSQGWSPSEWTGWISLMDQNDDILNLEQAGTSYLFYRSPSTSTKVWAFALRVSYSAESLKSAMVDKGTWSRTASSNISCFSTAGTGKPSVWVWSITKVSKTLVFSAINISYWFASDEMVR